MSGKQIDIGQMIIDHANQYLGIEEKPGNSGFQNELFEKRMRNIAGWQKGQAWCVYSVELNWREVYRKIDMGIDEELDKLFSASAVQTWENFSNSPRWITNQIPFKGAIIIWQKYHHGEPHWSGHAGIFNERASDYFIRTIEGNTNETGKREGKFFMEKRRKLNFHEESGLVMKGFIHPRQSFEKLDANITGIT